MYAFILAGGFATRLWPLTEKRAKPLLPLAGKPLIDHLLEQLPADLPVTVSINAAFERSFTQWKAQGNHSRAGILVEQTHKDTEKLGALGAVAQWITRDHITEDILLLTGDNYFGFPMAQFLTQYTPGTPLLAAHDIRDLRRAQGFGTVVPLPDGRHVAAFEEKPAQPNSSLVSTGMTILPAAHLPLVVEYAQSKPDNVGGIFEEFLRRSIAVEFRAFTEPWFDIGSFESYLEATRSLVGDHVLLGHKAACTETEAEGSVVLGNHSVIRHSVLRNVILFEHCTVENCVLTDCILDDHCTLKGIDLSRQMLREGTTLERK
ncbi:MAG: NDP-sugar synthase [Candidatus Peribacteraceae bacterium]|nr:NDP-sugar synthase [Candidatus Peribacteraceae bacterium]MDD5742280.1 NDP-sugar synthase [Candidatus Peribacteraceae bacterium]